MRSFHSYKDFLLKTAKKKKFLQEYVDNVYSLSIDDIKNLNERKWIITGLLELKQEVIFNEKRKSFNINDYICSKKDVTRNVYESNSTIYFKCGIHGDMTMIIEPGNYFWMDSEIVYFEHTKSKISYQDTNFLNKLLLKFNSLTYNEYRNLYKEKIEEKYHNMTIPVILERKIDSNNSLIVSTRLTQTNSGFSYMKSNGTLYFN